MEGHIISVKHDVIVKIQKANMEFIQQNERFQDQINKREQGIQGLKDFSKAQEKKEKGK